MVKTEDKTRITDKRVQVVLENLDLTAKELSDRTGLTKAVVKLIKDVERNGLRKRNPHGR